MTLINSSKLELRIKMLKIVKMRIRKNKFVIEFFYHKFSLKVETELKQMMMMIMK